MVGQGPARAHVGGAAASLADVGRRTSQRLPVFVAAVLALSFVLLMLVFRSVLVPLKAVLLNLLSIGAAYGVMVAVFQWGWGGALIGLEATVPIVSFIPMFLFAILFGLSMDYEVFLLSRVREEYLRTGDNGTAIVRGISGTARVITSAALIMVRGVPVLRRRRGPVDQDVRARPGHRDLHRRHGRADGAGAGDHDAAGPGQLVAAGVARPDAPRRPGRHSTPQATPTPSPRARPGPRRSSR